MQPSNRAVSIHFLSFPSFLLPPTPPRTNIPHLTPPKSLRLPYTHPPINQSNITSKLSIHKHSNSDRMSTVLTHTNFLRHRLHQKKTPPISSPAIHPTPPTGYEPGIEDTPPPPRLRLKKRYGLSGGRAYLQFRPRNLLEAVKVLLVMVDVRGVRGYAV